MSQDWFLQRNGQFEILIPKNFNWLYLKEIQRKWDICLLVWNTLVMHYCECEK